MAITSRMVRRTLADPRVEMVAEALWAYRASDANLPQWHGKTWQKFGEDKPDIAAIYRDNAAVAIRTLDRGKAT